MREYQRTSIWIMYDPSAVRILMVRLRMEDCRGCSQAISKDCSMLCKSTLLSTASNFSNISQTACSCINFLVLSWSHSTVVGDCSGVSLNRENWIFLPSTILSPVPLDWCVRPSWSVDRCTPSAFMLLLCCLPCLVALCCLSCGHLNETR